MRFGMILLFLVIAFCVAGSLIPQGESAMTYVRAYGASFAGLITAAGLHDVFHTWYFALLLGLLCFNLILCSILRFPAARKAMERLKTQARETAPDHPLLAGQAETLRAELRRRHFRQDGSLFFRGGAGAYGSFLTHLAILAVLLFGALVLMTPEIQDKTVMPGETLTLADGTQITCLSFHIEDESGRLDYASLLRAADSSGSRVKEQEIRVNEPMRFGEYKIYQQTYGTAGRVLVRNAANGTEETFSLTEPCFLSVDSRNGVYFQALYPGFVREEDGTYTLITSTSMGYADPVYSIRSITDGMSASVLAFPDETVRMGDISFTFLSPCEYPGLRIKRVSSLLYGGLYFAFALMVAGLYLCFFSAPVCVRAEDDGYAVHSPKPQQFLALTLEESLKPGKEPDP